MPFKKVIKGKDKGKYKSPSGRTMTKKQVQAYYAKKGKKMNYFQTIKILGIEYTIIERQPFHTEDHDMGISDSIRNEIIIRWGMNQDTKESTILHEVIHILSDKMGLGLEEKDVSCLESGLYSVGYRLK